MQVGKNFIKDVLLDGGLEHNIITEGLCVQLGLSKPKPTLYIPWMANQVGRN